MKTITTILLASASVAFAQTSSINISSGSNGTASIAVVDGVVTLSETTGTGTVSTEVTPAVVDRRAARAAARAERRAARAAARAERRARRSRR